MNQIFIGSSNEIGAFESGVAAKLLGAVPSVVVGGVITMWSRWSPPGASRRWPASIGSKSSRPG